MSTSPKSEFAELIPERIIVSAEAFDTLEAMLDDPVVTATAKSISALKRLLTTPTTFDGGDV